MSRRSAARSAAAAFTEHAFSKEFVSEVVSSEKRSVSSFLTSEGGTGLFSDSTFGRCSFSRVCTALATSGQRAAKVTATTSSQRPSGTFARALQAQKCCVLSHAPGQKTHLFFFSGGEIGRGRCEVVTRRLKTAAVEHFPVKPAVYYA